MAGVQQAICEVAAVSDSDCGARASPDGGPPDSRAGDSGDGSDPRNAQSEGAQDEASVARLDLGKTKRGALPAIQPAGLAVSDNGPQMTACCAGRVDRVG